MCRTSSSCDSNKGNCKMLEITKLETVKVRSCSTLPSSHVYLDPRYPARLAPRSVVQRGGRKSSLPLENSTAALCFPLKTPESHVMNDIYCLKGNHLRGK